MAKSKGPVRTTVFQRLLLVLGGLVAVALLLEAGLHLLPVNEVLLMQPVNAENPAMRFAPDRTMLWSKFADFSMRNRVHSNNYGFINDQDYETDSPLPLLAVIGDSFVEALMVPYAKTLQGRLAKALQGRARVYSFGVSGAPLSQYLAYAQWVRDEFHPEKMLFVVVGNDFDESLVKYKRTVGLHFFRPESSGFAMERVDYAPGLGVMLVTGSKLLMYLLKNADLPAMIHKLTTPAGGKGYVGQTDARAEPVRVADSRRVVDEFFSRLPKASGLGPGDICFVLDGMRPHLYSSKRLAETRGSYYDLMRRYFTGKAVGLGYRVVDMQPLFIQNFAANGKRFEYPQDGHWNGRGHGVAARAVRESGFLRGLAGE